MRLPAAVAKVESADARDDAAPIQSLTAQQTDSLIHDDDLLVVRPEPGTDQQTPPTRRHAHRDLATEMVRMAHDRDVFVHVLELTRSGLSGCSERTRMMFGVAGCPRQHCYAKSHAHDIDMDCVTSL